MIKRRQVFRLARYRNIFLLGFKLSPPLPPPKKKKKTSNNGNRTTTQILWCPIPEGSAARDGLIHFSPWQQQQLLSWPDGGGVKTLRRLFSKEETKHIFERLRLHKLSVLEHHYRSDTSKKKVAGISVERCKHQCPPRVQDGGSFIFNEVAPPARMAKTFWTCALMGTQSMRRSVPSHHASVSYMMYFANQNDSRERCLKTRQDAADQNQLRTAASTTSQRHAGNKLFSGDSLAFIAFFFLPAAHEISLLQYLEQPLGEK